MADALHIGPCGEEPDDWALVIHDGPATDKLVAIRAALGVGMYDVAALTQLLPGVVRRGTLAHLAPTLEHLQRYRVRAEVRPFADYPRAKDLLRPGVESRTGSRIIVPVGADDFGPLADCLLAYRWTDERFNVLPESDLAQIRPLHPAKARLAWDVLAYFIDPKQESLAEAVFTEVHSIGTRGDPEVVRDWLRQRIPSSVGNVIVSWWPETAVVTNINLFWRYWDDFCYPASDDVTVWSVNDEWAGVYHHEEQLFVGTRAITPAKSI